MKQPGLRLPDVAQRVRGEVRQLANTVGHRQSPAYYDEGADDVCLAGCAPPPQTSEAERTWPWIKDTNNQSVLENFIKQFGDTPFGAMAKARLAELKRQQVAVARRLKHRQPAHPRLPMPSRAAPKPRLPPPTGTSSQPPIAKPATANPPHDPRRALHRSYKTHYS